MTPQRRSRFFLSLRQLEQRLAAESKSKKSRGCPSEPEASEDHSAAEKSALELSASDYGSADASCARLSNVEINDPTVNLTSKPPKSKSFSSREGHAGACGIMKIVEERLLSHNNFVALQEEHPQVAIKTDENTHHTVVLNLERNGLEDNARAQKTTSTLVEDQVCHTSDSRFVKESGSTSQTSILQMQSRSDRRLVEQEFASVISATPSGSSMCDSIAAADLGDSCSPLLFPANWNPWEVDRNSNLSESNPPAIFLASPSFSYRVERPETHRPEAVLGGQDCEGAIYAANEQMDWTEQFSRLCVLLDLNADSSFAAIKSDIATQETDMALTCQHSSDAPAVKHEHPESLFYSKVAKVGEKICLQNAKALDNWVERLSKSQSEPFCLTVLLIAKASLESCRGPIETQSSLTYPRLVKDWLMSSHAPSKQ